MCSISLATVVGPLIDYVLAEMERKAQSVLYLPPILVTVLQPKHNSYNIERIDKIVTSEKKKKKEKISPFSCGLAG